MLDRLKRLLSSGSEKVNREELLTQKTIGKIPAVETEVILDDRSLTRFLELIEQTNEGEYTCAETLDLLDEYAEMVANHQDAATIMPLVKGHIEHCVDCTERYEALLRILEEPKA